LFFKSFSVFIGNCIEQDQLVQKNFLLFWQIKFLRLFFCYLKLSRFVLFFFLTFFPVTAYFWLWFNTVVENSCLGRQQWLSFCHDLVIPILSVFLDEIGSELFQFFVSNLFEFLPLFFVCLDWNPFWSLSCFIFSCLFITAFIMLLCF
jgi:hypothetical protein